MTTRCEYALALAEQGFYIHQLSPNSKEPVPGIKWLEARTRDAAVIRLWFDYEPDMNYGVSGGNNGVVIDADLDPAKGKDGEAALQTLEAEHGQAITWSTFTVQSPKGGKHYYLKDVDHVGNAHSFPFGIDVRGENGYVVGPGCHTEDDGANTRTGDYVVECPLPVASAPIWTSVYFQRGAKKQADSEKPLGELDTDIAIGQARAWLMKRDVAVQGENGDEHTYATACGVKDFGISELKCMELLVEVPPGQKQSWNDRCDPPWEIDGEKSLSEKIYNAYHYGTNRPGSKGGALMEDAIEKLGIPDSIMPSEDGMAPPESLATPDAQGKTGFDKIAYRGIEFAKRDIDLEMVIYEWLPAQGLTAILADRGTGKGLPVDEPVYTPWGAKRIGDIKPGEVICHPNGGKSTVMGVYPQGTRPCYEFTFEDGAIARCDDSHLWRVWISSKKGSTNGREAVLPMPEILRLFETHRLSIPTIQPLARAGKAVTGVDPYLLGLLLGDGSFGVAGRNVTYCTIDSELANVIIAAGFTEIKEGRKGLRCFNLSRLSGLWKDLERLRLMKKLSYQKFVPKKYLLAPTSIRLAVLQGLMDTDGTTSATHVEFTSASERLAKDVQYLARSLGARASLTRNESWLNGERKRDRFRVGIQSGGKFCPFRLCRKANAVSKYHPETLRRRITDIRPIGDMESVCIKVNAVDGLFVTRDFVVTHNTVTMLDQALRLACDRKWHVPPTAKDWVSIYLCGEGDTFAQLHFQAWLKYYSEDRPAGTDYMAGTDGPAQDRFMMMTGVPNLLDANDVKEWTKYMNAFIGDRRAVVYLDTWQRASSHGSQNDDVLMQTAFHNAEAIARSLKGPIVAAFHPPKHSRDTISGAYALENNTTTIQKLERTGDRRSLKLARTKGTGEGHYMSFDYQIIETGQENQFGKKLTGIVPVYQGGQPTSDTTNVQNELMAREATRQAFAEALAEFMANRGWPNIKVDDLCRAITESHSVFSKIEGLEGIVSTNYDATYNSLKEYFGAISGISLKRTQGKFVTKSRGGFDSTKFFIETSGRD